MLNELRESIGDSLESTGESLGELSLHAMLCYSEKRKEQLCKICLTKSLLKHLLKVTSK
jgi:hypothetical protein